MVARVASCYTVPCLRGFPLSFWLGGSLVFCCPGRAIPTLFATMDSGPIPRPLSSPRHLKGAGGQDPPKKVGFSIFLEILVAFEIWCIEMCCQVHKCVLSWFGLHQDRFFTHLWWKSLEMQKAVPQGGKQWCMIMDYFKGDLCPGQIANGAIQGESSFLVEWNPVCCKKYSKVWFESSQTIWSSEGIKADRFWSVFRGNILALNLSGEAVEKRYDRIVEGRRLREKEMTCQALLHRA